MRFGSREVADVVFRAKSKQHLGNRTFYKNEPVLYFDTLKTSGLEGAATTVYAQGGRGNPRLIAWEGERTMTFTMEDALISPEGLAILTGAGLISAGATTLRDEKGNIIQEPLYQHVTSRVEVKEVNTIELPEIPCYNSNHDALGFTVTGDATGEYEKMNADIFVMRLNEGIVYTEPCVPYELTIANGKGILKCHAHERENVHSDLPVGAIVLVDYYVKRVASSQQIEITADKFAGYYYIEASTLFRDEATGEDLPAEFIIPNGKVQSNFNFAMANSGDPSTFTFTVDAMPGYTKFDGTKKVLAVIQVIEDVEAEQDEARESCAKQDEETNP